MSPSLPMVLPVYVPQRFLCYCRTQRIDAPAELVAATSPQTSVINPVSCFLCSSPFWPHMRPFIVSLHYPHPAVARYFRIQTAWSRTRWYLWNMSGGGRCLFLENDLFCIGLDVMMSSRSCCGGMNHDSVEDASEAVRTITRAIENKHSAETTCLMPT